MKKLLLFNLLLYTMIGYSQELLKFGPATSLSFEDTNEYKFIEIDTNHVWFVSEPNKEILYLPSFNPYGIKALITDTSKYYKDNCKSSFQFKLVFDYYDYYIIQFEHKYDFEKNKDGGIIETSYDNGVTWQNILFDNRIMNSYDLELTNFYSLTDTISSYNNQPGFTGIQSDMKFVSVTFSSSDILQGDTMLLRYTISTDFNNAQNEGWMLDEFRFNITVKDAIKENKISSIKIHPNPTNSKLILESKVEKISDIKIFSLTGNLLLSSTGQNITTIDVSDLNKGIYFLFVKSESKNSWISKFCKI